MSRPPHSVKIPKGNLSGYANVRPLYTRAMPWWGTKLGTAGLLLCNVIIVGTAASSTWGYWTQPKAVSKPSSDTPNADGSIPEVQTVEWELRPVWQRGGLCFAHILAGCMFAGGLLGKRQMYIRSVHIASPGTTAASSPRTTSSAAAALAKNVTKGNAPPPEVRRLIIQSAADSGDAGFDFPADGAWLEEGADSGEVVLRSNFANLNSRFLLPLRGASIAGTPTTIDDARDRLVDEWYNLFPVATSRAKAAAAASSSSRKHSKS